jgi:hypothetical protein
LCAACCSPLITLEAGVPATKDFSWPVLAYGKDKNVNRAGYWYLGSSNRTSQALSTVMLLPAFSNNALNLNTVFGKPGTVPDMRLGLLVLCLILVCVGCPWYCA